MQRLNNKAKPFLKWAGGKRWLVAKYANLLPNKYNRYIEPFLGSGAVFFHLSPEKALLGDSNEELIYTYRAIKENWELVYRYLKEHHKNHSKEYYYNIRSFKPRSLASHAARLIYLNRTCWNGLYRVNKDGRFNVPIGTRSSVIFENDRFDQISKLLKKAEFHACDFEILIDKADEGDLVFVDPPYTVRHNNNSFIKYNERLFSWADQKRLYFSLKHARDRGVQIVGTNAYNQSVIDLYRGKFNTFALSRNSLIASKLVARDKYDELVILTDTEKEAQHPAGN